MLPLPNDLFALLASFAPLFSRRVWRYVPVLLIGALLAPGRRMVSTALRSVGLGQVTHFPNDHRVLNRTVWSSLAASHVLLDLLVHPSVSILLETPLLLLLESMRAYQGAHDDNGDPTDAIDFGGLRAA